MNYSNEQASKKKYLVPLVALLICGVAFVGTAYAYSASIETSGELNTQYYEITVNGKDTIELTEKLQFNSVKKDGEVTYTAVPLNKNITVAMAEKNNTEKFTITSLDAQITDAKGAKISGLSCNITYANAEDATTAAASFNLTLTIGGKLAAGNVPADSYKVTISITTEAA